MSANENLLTNLVTSGRSDNPDLALRYMLLNIALIAGSLFLIIFGYSVFRSGNTSHALYDWTLALICFLTLFSLRIKIPIQIPGGFAIGAFGVLCTLLTFSGDLHGFAGLWIFSYPLISIFVLGLQMGLLYSILLLCALMVTTIIPGLADYTYAPAVAARINAVYALVTLLAVVYEQIRISKDRGLARLTNELRVERDVITAMKDNLKTGLFLMNRDYVIQGAYSKPLEEILGITEIEGKKLTAFLAASLKAKERDTLEDYFNMVLNRQFETAMLEEINPISEFTYVDERSGGEKILRTAFTPVDRGLNDFYILGSFEDVSAARELERQLAVEEGKREAEMRALFQVIQIDPGVFGDFLADTEYEFGHINEILKNKDLSARSALVDIYQSVHAVKSNALILGLEDFSKRLHELENTIKQNQENEEVLFNDVLHIAVELERIMKETDKFRDTIRKIESFRISTGGSRENQEKYVLVETLSKTCDKAAAAQNKIVKFTVEDMEGTVLENSPRRAIKAVLTQLVRNSVYHGIESPEERKALGKDGAGNIRLSITREDGQIRLQLSDDGRGLDFSKIRDKALKLNLLPKPEEGDTNQLLKIIFSPGFSTADEADLYAGRGIGLNLVKERIRELRGSIKLSSEPGKGTAFNIFIPVESDAAESKVS
jgi:two-component system chemotaxis sensor kinase CheA